MEKGAQPVAVCSSRFVGGEGSPKTLDLVAAHLADDAVVFEYFRVLWGDVRHAVFQWGCVD